MKKITERAVEKGFDVEVYHTPLIPDKIGSIIIKDLNMAITTSSIFKENYYEKIDLNQYADKGLLAGYKEDLRNDQQLLSSLIDEGIKHIRLAKKEHDVLEQYYVPNMNFSAAGEKYDEILSRILDICESKATAATGSMYN